jgi:hypothetical protein
MIGLTSKFHRFIAEAGLAVSSIIAPTSMHAEPVQPEKRRKAPSNRDGVRSSDFMEDSKWEGIKWFDSRLAVYTVLDEMVNFQAPDKEGHFWKSVTYKIEVDGEVSYCVLSGIRNDGKSISVKAKIEKEGSIDELFYGLCKDLNGGNWKKPISRIVGVDGFRG